MKCMNIPDSAMQRDMTLLHFWRRNLKLRHLEAVYLDFPIPIDMKIVRNHAILVKLGWLIA